MVPSSRLAVPVLFIACMVFIALLAIPQISHAVVCSVLEKWTNSLLGRSNAYCDQVTVAGKQESPARAPAPAPAPEIKPTWNDLTQAQQQAANSFLDQVSAPKQTDPYQTATEFRSNPYDAYGSQFTSGLTPKDTPAKPAPARVSQDVYSAYNVNAKNLQAATEFCDQYAKVGVSFDYDKCRTDNAVNESAGAQLVPPTILDSASASQAPEPDYYSTGYGTDQSGFRSYDSAKDPSSQYFEFAVPYAPVVERGKQASPEDNARLMGTRPVGGASNLYTTDPSTNRELGPFPAPLEENSGPTKCWSWLSWVPGCEGSKTTSAAEDGGTVETYTPSYQPSRRSASQPYEDLQSVSYGPTSPTVPQPISPYYREPDPRVWPSVGTEEVVQNPLPDNWYKANPSVLDNYYPGVSPSPTSYTVRCSPGDSSCTDTPDGPVWNNNQPAYEDRVVEQYPIQAEQQYEPDLGAWDYSDNPYAGIPLEEDTAFQPVQQESQQAIESSGWQAFFDPSSWWPWGGDTEASNKPTRQFSTAVPFSETLVNQSLVASAFGAFLAGSKK